MHREALSKGVGCGNPVGCANSVSPGNLKFAASVERVRVVAGRFASGATAGRGSAGVAGMPAAARRSRSTRAATSTASKIFV